MQVSSHPERWRRAAAFAAVFIAVGVPFWLTPYARVSLPDALYGAGLLVAMGVTAFLWTRCAERFAGLLLAVGMAFPAVVFVRVAVETTADPTSHNLWPFEIAIAILVGLSAVLAGMGLGAFVRVLTRRPTTG
jgi:hypothetical protein